jgi:hypothetical protein
VLCQLAAPGLKWNCFLFAGSSKLVFIYTVLLIRFYPKEIILYQALLSTPTIFNIYSA